MARADTPSADCRHTRTHTVLRFLGPRNLSLASGDRLGPLGPLRGELPLLPLPQDRLYSWCAEPAREAPDPQMGTQEPAGSRANTVRLAQGPRHGAAVILEWPRPPAEVCGDMKAAGGTQPPAWSLEPPSQKTLSRDPWCGLCAPKARPPHKILWVLEPPPEPLKVPLSEEHPRPSAPEAARGADGD